MPKSLADIHSPDALDRAKIEMLNAEPDSWERLVQMTHADVDAYRKEHGLPPFDWQGQNRRLMTRRNFKAAHWGEATLKRFAAWWERNKK